MERRVEKYFFIALQKGKGTAWTRGQDGSAVLTFSGHGIPVSLAVRGDVVEVTPLLLGTAFRLLDDTAFPCSFWHGVDALVSIGHFRKGNLLDFDGISLTGKQGLHSFWNKMPSFFTKQLTIS